MADWKGVIAMQGQIMELRAERDRLRIELATGDEVSDATVYRFRVQGAEEQRTALPTSRSAFDETYEIEGEHPAEALGKLLSEIEWGILDGAEPFVIEFCGALGPGDEA